jgi:hypothetical protein
LRGGTTPQQAARRLFPPPLQWVHPPPRTSPSISCRVHKPVVNEVRLPYPSTAREESILTSSTGLPSRLGRRGYWRCRPVLPRQAPPPAPLWPLPRSSSSRFCAPLRNRGLALHLRQELFYSGGWAATTPSCLSHRVPVAFIALLNRLGRWHLLRVRKLHRQHTNLRHQYSTAFFKMAYLSGCGLRDLQLLGHAFVGHIAWLPRRRGQTSL